jgi:hypothetical protein
MFDLLKDLDKYQGIPPYASEMYGVYQPLLGWQSNLTKKWIQRAGVKFDPRVKRILDANLIPSPDHVDYQPANAGGGFTFPELYSARPLAPAEFKKDFKVVVARDLNSQFLTAARDTIKEFVDAHGGALPTGAEWAAVFPAPVVKELLEQANLIHTKQLREYHGAPSVTAVHEGGSCWRSRGHEVRIADRRARHRLRERRWRPGSEQAREPVPGAAAPVTRRYPALS